jgi:Mg-chelatase subunit ChlI
MGMAHSNKYGKVTVEFGDLSDSDEPVYIIRSKDKSAVDAVLRSRGAAEEIEASEEHILGIEEAASDISEWQQAHLDQVKVPD